MRNKKNVIIAFILVMVFVFSGCSNNLGDKLADAINESKPESSTANSEKDDKTGKEDKSDKDSDGLGGLIGSLFGSDDKDSDKDNSSSGNSSSSLESLFGDLIKDGNIEGLDGLEGIEGLEGLQGLIGSGDSDSNSDDGSYGGYSYDDMMNAFDQLYGDDDREKLEGHYKFPKCTSWSEWPSADTWKAMGMIDIQPKGCDFAKVQDDGQYIIDGIWNGYYAECQCDDGELQRIGQQLWDAGYRGVPVGDGMIVEADSIDDVLKISEYSENKYTAFYEYEGWILCVQVNLHTWDNSIDVGVYDATTMTETYENLKKNPSVDKSKAKEAFPNGDDIALIGNDFTGRWGKYNIGTEENPYEVEDYYMYSRDVTKAQWEKFAADLQNLKGAYCDGDTEDGWEGYSLYYNESNPNGFGYGYIGYCEKAGLMYYGFEKMDY